MVGEIRDIEIKDCGTGFLTGHVVLSTLHTNDAPGAVTRLVDMGLEPFLLSASLEFVLAQRLVRKICSTCSTEFDPKKEMLDQLGVIAKILEIVNFTGAGCDDCTIATVDGPVFLR